MLDDDAQGRVLGHGGTQSSEGNARRRDGRVYDIGCEGIVRREDRLGSDAALGAELGRLDLRPVLHRNVSVVLTPPCETSCC